MYCPSCALRASPDQKFCRSCGLPLDQVSQLLAEQLSESSAEQLSVQTLADLQQRKLQRWGSIAVISTIGLAFAVICGVIIRGMIVGEAGIIFGVLALTILIGLLTGFVFLGVASVKKRPLTRAPQPDLLPGPGVQSLAERYLEPLPSITEKTTELLVAEKKDPGINLE